MEIKWFDSTSNIISFCIQGGVIFILLVCLLFTLFKTVKRPNATILMLVIFLLAVFGFVFQYEYLFIISVFVGMTMIFFSLMTNIGDVRKFFANPFGRTAAKKSSDVAKIINNKELFAELEKAIVELSDRKIGALITIEKNTNLSDICKNGVPVNAPVSKELLSTIFYPGTRLHDGAVIVKDGAVKSASVFFTPTTKPFATKYGSRHRAALGISEISDAVTIVVSEETGFVSIAHEGAINQVEAESLAKTLANYF